MTRLTFLRQSQRAGLGPPADLFSSAGVPDHQKVGKEPAPAAPVPAATLAGSVGTRGETNNRLRPNSCRPPAFIRVSAPAARGSGCGQRCHRTALHRELTCRRLSERSGVPRSELGGSAA